VINNSQSLDGFIGASIKELMKSLLAKLELFGNQFFNDRVTLGFIGSAIVEGMNQCLKFGDYACKSSMNIDKSSENQLRLAKNQSHKRNAEMAKEINRTNMWTRSNTSEFLTDYMEGIAVKNFDAKKGYCVVCKSGTRWLVARTAIIDRIDYCDENKDTFKCKDGL
jgi:hypothetical protein